MAEFCEVLKQRKRMCDCNKKNCFDCSLCSKNNGKKIGCDSFVTGYPQEAEKIIMDWAKEHPVITNADKFKEMFGIEIVNGGQCDLFECKSADCTKCEYHGFWEREYIKK